MRRVFLVSMLLALVAGALLAAFLLPEWSARRALSDIVAPEAPRRARGWTWLSDDDNGAPRIARRIESVIESLETASDDAILDASDHLRNLGRWSWTSAPVELILRELSIRMQDAEPPEQRFVLEQMRSLPVDSGAVRAGEIFDKLLQSPDESIRIEALAIAVGGAPAHEALEYARLATSDSSAQVRRLAWLIRIWLPDETRDAGANEFTLPFREEIDSLEARLLAAVRLNPADASDVLATIAGISGPANDPDAFPAAYVLRESADPRAVRRIAELAAAGDLLAQRVKQAASATEEGEALRDVLRDDAQPVALRRLAAWRLGDWPEDSVIRLLEAAPVDEHGCVYGTSLLAERLLPRESAIALAASWLRDFDDDRKRAGALLCALLDANIGLLREVCDREDMPRVKSLMRSALFAAGSPVDDDDLAFVSRAVRGTGDTTLAVDPDIVVCLLLAGESDALAHLTSRPDLSDATWSVQWRSWMIERFVPEWHELTGRPVGGNARAITLHFDLLEALRLVTWRRLGFDAAARIYTTGASSTLTNDR